MVEEDSSGMGQSGIESGYTQQLRLPPNCLSQFKLVLPYSYLREHKLHRAPLASQAFELGPITLFGGREIEAD
jgi:hypothetical protein